MAMNYSDKQEDLTKDEWMDRLHAMRVTRADMNRLIMNYLVTGNKCIFMYLVDLEWPCVYFMYLC